MKKRAKKTADITAIYQNPQYRGKYVIVIKEKAYPSKSGKDHNTLLEKLIKKYPDEKPLVTYIPKEETLILIF